MPRSQVGYLALALWICTPRFAWGIQAQSSSPHVLEPLKSIEQTLQPGEKHAYQIQIPSGQFLHIVINHAGLDVAARLLDPSGNTVAAAENATRDQEPLPLSLIAPVDAVYRLEINLRGKNSAPGRYELTLKELRPPRLEDEKQIAAERAYAEGVRLSARGSEESLRQALAAYETALPLWRDLDRRREMAIALMNLGEVYFPLGDVKKALQYTEQALPLWRELGDRRGVASALHNMAVCSNFLGDAQKALEYYDDALPAFRELNDRQGEASTLNGIGGVYTRMGEEKEAIDSYNQALTLLASAEDQRLRAVILNNIGNLYLNQGPPEKALEYLADALTLQRSNGDRRAEGITLFNVGLQYSKLGQGPRAFDYFNQALSIAREVGDRLQQARVLNRLGLAYLDSGDLEKAFELLDQGVPMARASGDPEAEVLGLFYLARVKRASGKLAEAKTIIEAALEITEGERASVAGPDSRTSFFATVRKVYDLLIDVLVQLHQQKPGEGYDAEALQVSERARARGLLDLLNEERVDIRHDVEPALLERERTLRRTLSSAFDRQTRLLSGKHTDAQAAAAEKELQALVAEYRKLQSEIRASSPRYAALTQLQTLTLAEIQTEVLDPDTLLLEYTLGEDRSVLWAITKNSLTTHVLPKRVDIEMAARRVYELLTTNAVESKGTIREIDVLSRMVLGPLGEQLGRKRLVVVAEGALQYVPFAALVNPSKPSSPLIVDHEIVNLPSVSTLAVLRREMKGRPSAPKLLAVIADPVFDGQDPRVLGSRSSSSQRSMSDPLARSAREAGLLRFDRLYSSRQEAEAISALVPKTKQLRALDFDANRETATNAEIAQYRIVHFATHGLLNSGHPELSGLVLSLVDRQGKSQNGFLQTYDIYNLKLGADLVVLSACQTALGKEVRGEGLLGLTRGFMYAGAPRVVASLWNVPDRGTSELMKRFYQSMLAKGLSPAAALRAAQLTMWQEKRWSAPFYWAGFTLQGEWW